jgi:quinohemoprotein ethanol dehydrogenase
MRVQSWMRSSRFSFPLSKCAIALLCCAFSIEPLFAQEVDWPYAHGNLSGQRYANLDQITLTNVNQLAKAWVFNTGTNPGGQDIEENPIEVNGVVYFPDGLSNVFAVNAATGKQIWEYTPSAPVSGANRGVAYGQGLIFQARRDGQLLALNAKTGALVWSTTFGGASVHTYLSTAPQYVLASNGAGGTVPEVITGMSSDSSGVCYVGAFNPATGKLLWQFSTVEPHSWAGDSAKYGSGAVFDTPTFDPTLNMVYFDTGNPNQSYDGAQRAGANLYTESIVALDATSGELQWFFQMVHHDIWDYDGGQPTVLFTLNGVPAIEGATKAGYNFVLDRASGEPLFPYAEVAVPTAGANAAFQLPWPTQPVSGIETLVEETVEPDSLPPGIPAAAQTPTPWGPTTAWAPLGVAQMIIQPAHHSGYEWPTPAYSPRTQMWYSHAIYHPVQVSISEETATSCVLAGGNNSCGSKGTGAMNQAVGIPHGVYGGINMATGKVAWTVPILTSVPSSGVAVAGDLVFFADAEGLFYGVNAATGEILWVFDALSVPGGGGGGAAPAVYEYNGVEYVVYFFGGNPFIQTNTVDTYTASGDAVIAFALPSSVAAAAARSAAADRGPAQRGRVR